MRYYGLEVVSRAIAHKKQSVGRCARRRVLEANRTIGSALRLEIGDLTPPRWNLNNLLPT